MSAPTLFTVRRGEGRPLVLIHGLGSSWATWAPVFPALARARDVIAVDLPGFGESSPLPGRVTVETLTDAVEDYLSAAGLDQADVAGSSLGARIALELARRGHGGGVVALAPGGFWTPVQQRVFGVSIATSAALVRALQPIVPVLARSGLGRIALLSQFSAHPRRLEPSVVQTELRSIARAPSFDEALDALAHGPTQAGAGFPRGRVAIGWGRQDRVTLPSQASTALERFPSATFHGFHDCGHFPHWDQPARTVRFILEATGSAQTGSA
ncbi:MAG: alpha/beta fold hydrolase [Burkholderiaceae bacterium]|nr:alpha/beta fold hydrolase [Microbacteriaceae bacterium]